MAYGILKIYKEEQLLIKFLEIKYLILLKILNIAILQYYKYYNFTVILLKMVKRQ